MSNQSVLWGLALSLVIAQGAVGDVLYTRSNNYNGKVLRVVKDAVTIQVGDAELSINLSDIVREDITAPAEYKAGLAALKSQNYTDAVANLRPSVDRLAGLRSPWIIEAVLGLGDAYIGLRDYPSAKKVLEDFKRIYPTAPQTQGLEIKFGHILSEQKDFTRAVATVTPTLDKLLKKDFLTPAEEMLIGEGLVVIGDCQVADGKKERALDTYLKVVTLFDRDELRAAEAQYKAGLLFEELGNWKRARDSYTELLKGAPPASFSTDAKRRLDAIKQAHPE